MQKGYEVFRIKALDVQWRKLVWNKHTHPRFALITWLVRRNKLRTRSWLFSHGLIDEEYCPLCSNGVEDIEHLFFGCEFTKKALVGIMQRMGLKSKGSNFFQWWQWVLRISEGGKGKAIERQRLEPALIYEI